MDTLIVGTGMMEGGITVDAVHYTDNVLNVAFRVWEEAIKTTTKTFVIFVFSVFLLLFRISNFTNL